MSKETKQDRLARAMFDQVTEHLIELKGLETAKSTKESDIERWAQSFLKNCLGYTSSAGYSIKAQDSKGNLRPDLVVLKADKPIFLIEVKKLGFNLDKSDFRSGKVQLSQYLSAVGNVRWGILCNGYEWVLFDFSNPSNGGVEIAKFDILSDSETVIHDKKFVEDFCYELLSFHETGYANESWVELYKEATAISPESLVKAILDADTIKYLARSIKGEHDYRVNLDSLTDKVFYLLKNGLDDIVPNWNEQKEAEYTKFIKAQKKSMRKTKKASAKKEETIVVEASVVKPIEPPTHEVTKAAS